MERLEDDVTGDRPVDEISAERIAHLEAVNLDLRETVKRLEQHNSKLLDIIADLRKMLPSDPDPLAGPVCPQCGSGDPLFMNEQETAVGSADDWKCQQCGHSFQIQVPSQSSTDQ
jgi:Zn ribbon nucleic-acid-binding protein